MTAGSSQRSGARVCITAGSFLRLVSSSALAGAVSGLWQLYILYGGAIAVGVKAVWSPLVSTVSRWFVARRVLALGLAVLVSGSGVFFIAPLAEFLIATAGWRLTYVWLGAISGSLIVLAAFFLVRDPAARGSMP
ncbi:MAG: MFS transporter [Alphaproteobacteria bacterium]|nr:MFS transporter [Alphaproteobacteria bacterium]